MTPFHARIKLRRLAAALAAAGLLFGCTQDSGSLMDSARQYLAGNDRKAAIIQLKNVLQKEPDLAEARFLLGRTLLAEGDAVSAEVELGKAIRMGHPPEQVLPEHARALLALREYSKVIREYGSTTLPAPAATASLKTSVAFAHAALTNDEKAEAALAQALEAAPDHAPALLLKARLAAGNRDFDAAFALVDRILARTPDDVEALQYRGQLLSGARGDMTGAEQAYRKALAVRADLPAAHVGLFQAHLARKDLDAAARQLAEMKQALPNHPQTRLVEGQLAFLQRDDKTAREVAEQLLRIVPQNAQVLQLLGAVEFRSGSLLQARTHLTKAVQAAPGLVLARRLLARTYLRTGQPGKALEVILPLARTDRDAEALAIAAEAHLHEGELEEAEQLYARAAKLDPANPRRRTTLALTRLAAGDAADAFSELESVSASDPGVTADLALVAAHMRRKEYAAALQAVARLEQKQPDKPLASALRGRVQLAQKDRAAARRSFERAAQMEPSYFPAATALAALDLADKQPDAARKRFDAVLKADPSHMQARLALAELRAREGAPNDEVARMIAEVVQAHPGEAAPRMALIQHHARNRDYKAALAAAQEATVALPENLPLMGLLAKVQAASGDTHQAMTSFGRIAALRPESPEPLLQMADVQLAAKNAAGALESAQKAVEVAPDSMAARRRLIVIAVQAGQPAVALEQARAMQKLRPDEAVGFMSEGDVHAHLKQWAEAVAPYRKALDKADSTPLAIRLYTALVASGARGGADKFASGWMKQHPKDAAFLIHAGNLALERKDLAAAEARFMQVLSMQPDNGVALNNIAWAMASAGKPGALAYAEKANRLQPNQPAFMDTLAMLLAQDGQVDKAIELQKKAVELSRQNPMLRLNLAKLYVKADRSELARAELKDLARLGDKFKGQADVEQLLEKL